MKISACSTYPRGHGGTEDVEVGDTSLLTSFSINGEYSSITFSARRGWLLTASVAFLMKRVLGNEQSRSSWLSFYKSSHKH